MPTLSRTVNRKLETINIKQETIKNSFKFQVSSFKFQVGFSLIELLVVISLFGIAASLVTASYLSFERNQRLKSAASQLKSDLRLVQNNATSGNKDILGTACNPNPPAIIPPILGGWYLTLRTGDSTYSIGGDCVTGGTTEVSFSTKTISLPRDIIINKISYQAVGNANFNLSAPMGVFFRPLANGVSFHDTTYGVPTFLKDTDGTTLEHLLPQPPQSAITVQLANSALSRCYQVKIELSGEVNETQPAICVFS